MVRQYKEMEGDELRALYAELRKEYRSIQAQSLKLNMARGVPCLDQLDLSMGMMDALSSDADLSCSDGTDCRNYGTLDGIPEAKELMSGMMEVPPENIIIYGNSSLNVMYDTISRSFTHGVMGQTPWCRLDKVKFICIVPGYDRHFGITEYFGIENIPVPMLADGPDMDMVEELVSTDPAIKGIWCVPKYSNPTGNSYSDEVIRRFARLKPAASDFRIYWDNAYTIHHLYEEDQDYILEILTECRKAGNPDLVYKFASTSKITFPGSGIAAIATSLNNLADIKNQMKHQTIGHDKVNQLRHVRFFGNFENMKLHMKKHADILRPKFQTVARIFHEELDGLGLAQWTEPKGGYFMALTTMEGTARAIVDRCRKGGVQLTPAGATYPGGVDPMDNVIRIAPSSPPIRDLEEATYLLALSVKMESIKKILALRGENYK